MKGQRLQQRFTIEEKNDFLEILIEYPTDNVTKFIAHAEFYCQDMLFLLSEPKRGHLLEDSTPVLHSFKKSLEYLQQMEKGHLSFFNHASMNDRDNGRAEEIGALLVQTSQEAWNTVNSLTAIIEQIEKSPSLKPGKRGHSSLDELKKSFVVKLVEIFHKYLSEPTAYQFGGFSQAVQVCLKAVGLPHESPRRLVEFAIKAIPQNK